MKERGGRESRGGGRDGEIKRWNETGEDMLHVHERVYE